MPTRVKPEATVEPGTLDEDNGKYDSPGFQTANECLKDLERRFGPHSDRWFYRDAEGRPVGAIIRWDRPDGKLIRPISLCEDGRWRNVHMPTPRPLYRLPELLAASHDETVWVAEGERCCDTLLAMKLVSVTSSGGAGSARQTNWEPLAGRDVVIVTDNDKAGRDYSESVARILTSLDPPATVRILDLSQHAPELPEGGDIVDVVNDEQFCGLPLGDAAGLPELADLLRRLAAEAPVWRPEEPNATDGGPGDDEGDGRGKKPGKSRVAKLVEIGQQLPLWRDRVGTAYVKMGRISRPVQSAEFAAWLVRCYRKANDGDTPSREDIKSATDILTWDAMLSGDVASAHVRVAGTETATYIDLGDPSGTIIEVDARGWRVCDNPTVRFVRHDSLHELPMPERGGDLGELFDLLGIDGGAAVLLKAWMTIAAGGKSPYPVLLLSGPQGAGKTTIGRCVKLLIDPTAAPIRSEPKDGRDLAIACSTSSILVFDNLSAVSAELSDMLCRVASGTGFATRTLYTDRDETRFEVCNPIILTSIVDLVQRGDLADRCLKVDLPHINSDRRLTERDLWKRFHELRPRLLGAVLDRVAAAYRALPGMRLTKRFRMADSLEFALAAEHGLGEPTELAAAVEGSAEALELSIIEQDPLASAITKWMRAGGCQFAFEGTATELLSAVSIYADDAEKRARGWPHTPRGIVAGLKRLAPVLARIGVTYAPGGKIGRGTDRRPTHKLYWSDNAPDAGGGRLG